MSFEQLFRKYKLTRYVSNSDLTNEQLNYISELYRIFKKTSSFDSEENTVYLNISKSDYTLIKSLYTLKNVSKIMIQDIHNIDVDVDNSKWYLYNPPVSGYDII